MPRRFYGASAAPPPLRLRPCPHAAAAFRRRCAAESPAEQRDNSPLRWQVPAAARGRPRTPRPRGVTPLAQPRPKAPAAPVARTRAPPPRSASFSSHAPPSPSRAAAAAGSVPAPAGLAGAVAPVAVACVARRPRTAGARSGAAEGTVGDGRARRLRERPRTDDIHFLPSSPLSISSPPRRRLNSCKIL